METNQSNIVVAKNLLLTAVANLVLADRRLYNYLLHHAVPHLTQQLDFTIALTELKGIYGTGIPLINRLQESLKRLMRTLIEFEVNPQKWVLISLLDKIELNEQTQILHYSYTSYCRDILLNPILLEKCLIQAHFTQKYSHFIYEILSEAYFSGQKELKIEVSDLRSRLFIEEKKLSNFGDFKRFLLMPAINEINIYASFITQFDTERKGMKVTHVIFQMVKKREISHSTKINEIIPPKRPLFFIENPQLEAAYAYLLNAETAKRRELFDTAIKRAATAGVTITLEEDFDCPDIWFKWIQDELMKKLNY